MLKYALLCGSAPEQFRQKKLEDMTDFLGTEEGGSVPPSGIIVFPYGISELQLESALGSVFDQEADELLLYLCTLTPVSDKEESIWLGGEEIRRDVISYYQTLADKIGTKLQVVYDVCGELVDEAELGYEKVAE